MAVFDATESLTPFKAGQGDRGIGAILFDATQLRQADPRWFDPALWGQRAQPVDDGGRGSAWYIDASHGPCVLRHYRRGGAVAHFTRDRYLWRGADRVRSFAEFRLLRALLKLGLPVPQPIAASYVREGFSYTAAILMQRLVGVRSLAGLVAELGEAAPWAQAGQLIARFHRAGVDHADLNAHNVLFDAAGKGWLIDFDRGARRIPDSRWRERNLARLARSLHKQRGARVDAEITAGVARLRAAYEADWTKGF